MGITYTHHTMVGAYVLGQKKDLYTFLENNGYPLTKKQKETIDKNDQLNYDIVEMLSFKDMDIVILNSWSMHDFIIGYHVKNKSQTKKYAAKFSTYFPNIKAKYHDFTEVS